MKSPVATFALLIVPVFALGAFSCSAKQKLSTSAVREDSSSTEGGDTEGIFFGFVRQSHLKTPEIMVLTKPNLANPYAETAIAVGRLSDIYLVASDDDVLNTELLRISRLNSRETQIAFEGSLHQESGMFSTVQIKHYSECGREFSCRKGLKTLFDKIGAVASGTELKFRSINVDRNGGEKAKFGFFSAQSADEWRIIYEQRLNDILPFRMPNFEVDFSKEMIIGYQSRGNAPLVTSVRKDEQLKKVFISMETKVAGRDCLSLFTERFSAAVVVVDAGILDDVDQVVPVIKEVKVDCVEK
jgi:hypothetical protein